MEKIKEKVSPICHDNQFNVITTTSMITKIAKRTRGSDFPKIEIIVKSKTELDPQKSVAHKKREMRVLPLLKVNNIVRNGNKFYPRF